jgi:glycosyltransferase involved in cell wall biosynthesis
MQTTENQNSSRRFIVGTPARSVCDDYARVLETSGNLRLLVLGTRRGTSGVPPERTRLNPAIGLASYIAARMVGAHRAESFRFRLLPWYDHWLRKQLQPGDHIISSYGYANDSFEWVREHGGKTFVDAGNSHIEDFWQMMTEEHLRWGCARPPVARHWYERSRAMLAKVDYIFSPSSHVTRSFLNRGFKTGQILKTTYPIDLSLFQPPETRRPQTRPLTIINTGSLSLRKGTPYLLEAFEIVRRQHPTARLLLTRIIQDDVRAVLERYRHLPIDWSPPLNHAQLSERLRQADIFVLPSLEEGLVRTALEAMACGLPVILTPNTGTADYVQPGLNGEIVPIRDAQAVADAILKWADLVLTRQGPPMRHFDTTLLSYEHFKNRLLSQLAELNLVQG